jgi:hypothetical protein
MLLASDADDRLVQVPNVSRAWRLAAKALGISRSELLTPPADRLVRDEDTALEQHLLDEPEAQRIPEVQPNRMGDDLGWESMALVADGLGHAHLLGQKPLTKGYRDIDVQRPCFRSFGDLAVHPLVSGLQSQPAGS